MIKLEITDPHLLDKKALQETAIYLMALSGGKLVIPEAVPTDAQMIAGLKAKAEELERFAAEKPKMTLQPMSIDDQLDMQQLNGGLDSLGIEEELIPVPAEVVNIPAPPPSAAEIFNPVNSLNLPAVPKPSVELDIHGMPWDLRIHARTKTKMKDGSWKKLRGVGPDVVKRVEGELKAVQNIPAPPVSVPVPVPPVTANAVIPAAPAVAAVPGFTDLMALVTKSITEGTLKRDQVVEVLKPFGIPSLPLVSTRLDLIPAIMLALEGVINAPR